MRIEVLNGVNLNLLGRRDPELYGRLSIEELETRIYDWASVLGLHVRCRQTNDEGEYIGWCHAALDGVDALIINPGAWSHYSRALQDALEMISVPVVEVHLSNVDEREEWRRTSVISGVVTKRVVGRGPDGYREALEYLASAS